ncbi:MAG: pyridoxamine 5'-phosphate oxidase family protein [Pseudotabrizicola sp.]|uniref:pyridoxamine 5'-phosphate oxidase family protein n=1 Tax=Pseudotabrizicola sp. TaxID=2939647 RepID=UPI002721686B|nr:pyridoxamine 5'-phosphate oxidase family protein [Pseudotabrizicola sp.]MDO8884982.1 pyridoxamine 5'-phosphate oxidase family protein [Pseudotabrizicola sp.]MDP2082892.1 pyridoxamine 5'-phosphate oxidase family protein [Pseudotabrizicola sp.]MDZ7574424.1 pyridoxamine 5'-phosphate oxidase family protein [Pseudotabrizicola sp.]
MSVEKFWKELEGVRSSMLAIGSARHVPMAPYAKQDDRAIWFITAQGTALVEAVTRGETEASLIVTGDSNIHARIEGSAAIVADRAKLEELWNPVASSWFDGIDDPDIRLVKLTPSAAEVWLTSGALGFAFELVKSKVTGEQPDMGEHFSLAF